MTGSVGSIFDELLSGMSPTAPELPDAPSERAMTLRNGLISRATGGTMDDGTYKLLRKEFMDDTETRALLPSFVRTCRDPHDFWEHIKASFASYAERRAYLREQFDPLLSFLERRSSPAVEAISDVLMNFSEEGVHRAWQKALKRSADDPEGAITAARTLLESVCKHILDDAGASAAYSAGDDLPKLYRVASEHLNLAPSQHTEDVFKRVLGGCSSIVEGLGSLRNKVGDAHGQGRRPVRVAPRHAHLAVNLAGAMATFLIETASNKASPSS